MAYQIQIDKSALKQLSKIEKPTREKFRMTIDDLSQELQTILTFKGM